MGFIKLTEFYGGEFVYVNPNHIIKIREWRQKIRGDWQEGTTVELPTEVINVKESAQVVVNSAYFCDRDS